jgi:hypothetical protein
VRADADPAARERDLWGVEAAGGQQFGADDGADEGAVCEEEYVDYVCGYLLLGGLGGLLTVWVQVLYAEYYFGDGRAFVRLCAVV